MEMESGTSGRGGLHEGGWKGMLDWCCRSVRGRIDEVLSIAGDGLVYALQSYARSTTKRMPRDLYTCCTALSCFGLLGVLGVSRETRKVRQDD